jgi:hypothetical protein
MTWLDYREFASEFRPPPSRDTVESWARAGEVERRQFVPRGRVYYRWRDGRPEAEDALMEALNAATKQQKRASGR